jgi:hypothetical protein
MQVDSPAMVSLEQRWCGNQAWIETARCKSKPDEGSPAMKAWIETARCKSKPNESSPAMVSLEQ